MAWRLANSLVTFRDQVNAKYPGRSKVSDGTIGDAAHAARLSQHNPNSAGVVCAIDITEDLSVGLDCNRLMEELDASNDPRIFYIIHDRAIDNSDDSRTPYYGSNPHTRHLHLSVKYTEPGRYDDGRPWNLPMLTGGAAPAPTPAAPGVVYEARVDAALGSRVLSVGKVGSDVAFVQRWHGIGADGYFGPATRNAVAATQNRNNVPVDGIVGPVTWRLMGVGAAPAKPTPPPAPAKPPALPRWDLPAGHYFGHKAGPAKSHGGFYASERDNVKAIQQWLIFKGCVPGVTDWKSNWADGLWETATSQACQRWFARYRPGQRYTDRVYSDDYAVLGR